MFTKIEFYRFTAFESLRMAFSPGINIFIGENGTGKTHILKALYSSAEITAGINQNWAQKMVRVFLPSDNKIGRLVKRGVGRRAGFVEVCRNVGDKEICLKQELSSLKKRAEDAEKPKQIQNWLDNPIGSVYIPVKEMLANAPGFKSLYESKAIHFEEVYADIISKALMPPPRGPADKFRRKIGKILRQAIDGNVMVKNEEFFLKDKHGILEFTLLAEGYRKLGLLWTLVQNGTLSEGTTLFWDEPEANLNPKLTKTLIEVLLELQRMGVQMFLSTHNELVPKWVDILSNDKDKKKISYHSLYRDETEDGEINVNTVERYADIHPNPMEEAYELVINEDIEAKIRGLKK